MPWFGLGWVGNANSYGIHICFLCGFARNKTKYMWIYVVLGLQSFVLQIIVHMVLAMTLKSKIGEPVRSSQVHTNCNSAISKFFLFIRILLLLLWFFIFFILGVFIIFFSWIFFLSKEINLILSDNWFELHLKSTYYMVMISLFRNR